MMVHPKILKLVPTVMPRIWLCVLLGVLAAAVAVTQGFLFANVIDRVFEGQALRSLAGILIWVAILVLLRAGILWAKRWSELWVSEGVKIKLRNRMLEKLYLLGPGYTLTHGNKTALSSTVDGVEAMEGYFSRYLPQVFITAIVPTLILGYLFFVDLWVATLVLVAIIVALAAPKLWENLLGTYGKSHWDAYTELNHKFINAMQGMPTLLAFHAAEKWGQELAENSQQLYRSTMKQLAVSMLSTGVVSLAMKTGSAVALGVASLRAIQGHLDFETLVVTLFLVSECVRPLSDLDQAWHAGYMGISSSSGIQSILDAKPTATPPLESHELPSWTKAPAVTIRDLAFTYADKKEPTLHEISLSLAPGKTTALVGASGSGKTTLVSLLMRFYEPQKGGIDINGLPICDLAPADLRDLFAIVSQDTYLFYGTIAENLRIAKPDASQEELENAASKAQIHDFLRHLPQGYETVVGERGHALSGGQRQRLAIARALLKNAPILILDEATASVDAATEQGIQETLQRVTQNRTTLVIAHRLNTVVHADCILVLEAGKITERGTHHQLLDQRGTYAKLFTLAEQPV